MEPVQAPPTDEGDDGEIPDGIVDSIATRPLAHQHERTSGEASRFPAWVALLAASTVGIIALSLGRRKGSSAEKWSIWVLVLSFVLSLLGTLCYLFARPVFLIGPAELFLVCAVYLERERS